ncbi:hypothetical protein GYM75_00530 [Gilliamella sp. ESL0441]|nr:hypothetical protein GYM75_00530 [Gilliamella sp. ESL0441]
MTFLYKLNNVFHAAKNVSSSYSSVFQQFTVF